jgi:hypothetical protein
MRFAIVRPVGDASTGAPLTAELWTISRQQLLRPFP